MIGWLRLDETIFKVLSNDMLPEFFALELNLENTSFVEPTTESILLVGASCKSSAPTSNLESTNQKIKMTANWVINKKEGVKRYFG